MASNFPPLLVYVDLGSRSSGSGEKGVAKWKKPLSFPALSSLRQNFSWDFPLLQVKKIKQLLLYICYLHWVWRQTSLTLPSLQSSSAPDFALRLSPESEGCGTSWLDNVHGPRIIKIMKYHGSKKKSQCIRCLTNASRAQRKTGGFLCLTPFSLMNLILVN